MILIGNVCEFCDMFYTSVNIYGLSSFDLLGLIRIRRGRGRRGINGRPLCWCNVQKSIQVDPTTSTHTHCFFSWSSQSKENEGRRGEVLKAGGGRRRVRRVCNLVSSPCARCGVSCAITRTTHSVNFHEGPNFVGGPGRSWTPSRLFCRVVFVGRWMWTNIFFFASLPLISSIQSLCSRYYSTRIFVVMLHSARFFIFILQNI